MNFTRDAEPSLLHWARALQDFARAAPAEAAPAADVLPAGEVDPVVRDWLPVLRRLEINPDDAQRAMRRAQINATGFLRELMTMGLVEEHVLFRAIADDLGLEFLDAVDPRRLTLSGRDAVAALGRPAGLPYVTLAQANGHVVHVLCRVDLDLRAMRLRLERAPHLVRRLRIAPPSLVRAAIVARSRERLLDNAQNGLFLKHPALSARIVANAWQGAFVAALAILLLTSFLAAPVGTLFAINVVATVTFLGCIAIRLLALKVARPIVLARLEEPLPSDLPVYSVLVALYRERAVIPQLLVALGQLQWPHSKLEIKLVCEADDEETLSALRAHRLRPFVEIVTVPPGTPRTKPKALCYALPLCSGELVTLFDAEDRPHPLQLLEAWQRFRDDDEELACLQAPLVIKNIDAHPLSRMFAFEYAGLFRGLLPWLARSGRILPLGGTSNHFRRAALDEVGGWDPYNVTEDADLGLRFRRFGYRTGVLSHPTIEDAPETMATWLPQRVRWFKGWLQTWLVHMRDPRRLWRELGPANFLLSQVLFLGMVVSALVHPLMLVSAATALVTVFSAESLPWREIAIIALCLTNLACGYGAFIAIGSATLGPGERDGLGAIVLLTPVYWLLLSVAAWLALWEIYRRPHHWHKTPHEKARRFPLRPAVQSKLAGVSARPEKARR